MNTLILLLVVSFVSMSVQRKSRVRPKRIIDGQILKSHEYSKTQHFITFMRYWACYSDQTFHPLSNDCQGLPFCGGTLLTPDFVLTACHCISWTEFYRRGLSTGEERKKRALPYVFDRFKTLIKIRKMIHTIFSDVMLFAGSTNYYEMKQKRHAQQVFPHARCAGTDTFGYREDHDVALVQACQPFDVTTEFVKLAPRKPLRALREQYDSLVKRGSVCLQIGVGRTLDEFDKVWINDQLIINTEYVRYIWRSLKCWSSCQYFSIDEEEGVNCNFCTDHYGKFNSAHKGDSGSPLICDNDVIAVLHTGDFWRQGNVSANYGYPLHCIKDYLTNSHLNYLKTLNPTEFHPLNLKSDPELRRFAERSLDYLLIDGHR